MKILYICTHNRCRSILSEAITNHLAKGKIQAFSAGSQPVGHVHPLSIKYLQEKGIATEGLKSQSWNEFEADQPDVVVTVCDSAASETCPVWFGNTIKVHWGLSDPSKLEGSDDEIRDAFFAVMKTIEQRIDKLLALDLEGLSKADKLAALSAVSNPVQAKEA
ncbi:MAG: low molecular weight phosphatase family protein [Alteromonadaceae bacterium]|nr:MAG: low molecular weight phosphatase family protein [Alteromonadaceae bacterium]